MEGDRHDIFDIIFKAAVLQNKQKNHKLLFWK